MSRISSVSNSTNCIPIISWILRLSAVIDLIKKKGGLIEERLEVLRSKTIAIDADILIKKARANALKSL